MLFQVRLDYAQGQRFDKEFLSDVPWTKYDTILLQRAKKAFATVALNRPAEELRRNWGKDPGLNKFTEKIGVYNWTEVPALQSEIFPRYEKGKVERVAQVCNSLTAASRRQLKAGMWVLLRPITGWTPTWMHPRGTRVRSWRV